MSPTRYVSYKFYAHTHLLCHSQTLMHASTDTIIDMQQTTQTCAQTCTHTNLLKQTYGHAHTCANTCPHICANTQNGKDMHPHEHKTQTNTNLQRNQLGLCYQTALYDIILNITSTKTKDIAGLHLINSQLLNWVECKHFIVIALFPQSTEVGNGRISIHFHLLKVYCECISTCHLVSNHSCQHPLAKDGCSGTSNDW